MRVSAAAVSPIGRCGRGLACALQACSRHGPQMSPNGHQQPTIATSSICQAATEAGVAPDRVKFLRTVRITRRRAADLAFPP